MSSGKRAKRTAAINPAGMHRVDDPHYQRKCTFAVSASVESLVERATAAGWERQHVLAGILLVAARQMGDLGSFEQLALLQEAEQQVSDSLQ